MFGFFKKIYEAERNAAVQRPIIQVELVQLQNTLYMAILESSKTVPNVAAEGLSDLAFSRLLSEMNQPNIHPPLALAFAQQGVIVAALRKDVGKTIQIVQEAVKLFDEDGGLELIDTLSKVFEFEDNLLGIASIYQALFNHYPNSDVRAAILDHFCDSLEEEDLSLETEQPIRNIILDIAPNIGPFLADSLALSNAMTRFTGCIFRCRAVDTQFVQWAPTILIQTLPDWQNLMRDQTNEHQVSSITQMD